MKRTRTSQGAFISGVYHWEVGMWEEGQGVPEVKLAPNRCCLCVFKQRSEWNGHQLLFPADRPWGNVMELTWDGMGGGKLGRRVAPRADVEWSTPFGSFLLLKPSNPPPVFLELKKGVSSSFRRFGTLTRGRSPGIYWRTTMPLRRELRSTYSASSSDDEHESSYEQREPPQSRRTRSPLRVMP